MPSRQINVFFLSGPLIDRIASCDNSICIFFQDPWGLHVLVPKKEKREAEAEAKPYYGYGYGVPLVAVETVELEPCKVCILNAQHVL